jgi:prophage tail gpP-like protein
MADPVQDIVVTAGAAVPDVVSVEVNGQTITGWTDVRITRRAEGLPNDFDVGLTVTNPSDLSAVVAYAGQSCVVRIGKDPVITGYIDRDTNSGSATSHRLGLVGRGQCADLVDCSAEYPKGQISGGTAIDIATKIAEPYGIRVYQKGQPLGLKPIPQFNLNYGETAQEIIDRVCTYDGLLYYEDEDGNLVLDLVGSDAASSGIVYGQNVQEWSVSNSMDQRFSDYTCASLSVDILEDLGGASLLYFTAKDPNVPRHRTMYLVAESVSGSWALCQIRALWEAARRAGRGTSATAVVDSWRDTGGTLWTPNTLIPVTLPGLRFAPATQLCVSEVTYHFDLEGGTRAEISVLPEAAFQPQPIVIQPTPLATGELVTAPAP